MKYLIIGAVIAFLILLIYSRLRPYIELLRKVSGALKGSIDQTSGPTQTTPATQRKLVRCAACGTWIPATRAIASGSKLPEYCSRECLENSAAAQETKIAG